MIAPKIHLNGTDGRILRDQYQAAVTALFDAVTALEAIEIHGRDYYTIVGDSDAVNKAFDTRRLMVERVNKIRKELFFVLDHIMNQLDERGHR